MFTSQTSGGVIWQKAFFVFLFLFVFLAWGRKSDLKIRADHSKSKIGDTEGKCDS